MRSKPVKSELEDLWRRFKVQGCGRSRDVLIDFYRYLVTRSRQRIIPTAPIAILPEDLDQEGYIALIKAVDHFDLDRKVKFESYAISMIRGALLEHLRREDWAPRLVRTKQKLLAKARTAVAERQADVTDKAVAAELEMSLDEFYNFCREAEVLQVASVDDVIADTDDSNRQSIAVLEVLASPDLPPDVVVERLFVDTHLKRGINWLPSLERATIVGYYHAGRTLKELAKEIGRSESRAHQLHTQAVYRLAGYLQGASDRQVLSNMQFTYRVGPTPAVAAKTVPSLPGGIMAGKDGRAPEWNVCHPSTGVTVDVKGMRLGLLVAYLAVRACVEGDPRRARVQIDDPLLERAIPARVDRLRCAARLCDNRVLIAAGEDEYRLGTAGQLVCRSPERDPRPSMMLVPGIFPGFAITFGRPVNIVEAVRELGAVAVSPRATPAAPPLPLRPLPPKRGDERKGSDDMIAFVNGQHELGPKTALVALFLRLRLEAEAKRFSVGDEAEACGLVAASAQPMASHLKEAGFAASDRVGYWHRGPVKSFRLTHGGIKQDVYTLELKGCKPVEVKAGEVYDLDSLVVLAQVQKTLQPAATSDVRTEGAALSVPEAPVPEEEGTDTALVPAEWTLSLPAVPEAPRLNGDFRHAVESCDTHIAGLRAGEEQVVAFLASLREAIAETEQRRGIFWQAAELAQQPLPLPTPIGAPATPTI